MTTLSVYWSASDALLRAEAIELGEAGARQRTSRFLIADMTPEHRAMVLPLAKVAQTPIGAPVAFEIDVTKLTTKKAATVFSETARDYLDEKPFQFSIVPPLLLLVSFAADNAKAREEAELRAAAYKKERAAEMEAKRKAAEADLISRVAQYDTVFAQFLPVLRGTNVEAILRFKFPEGFDASFAFMDRKPLYTLRHDRVKELREAEYANEKAAWIQRYGSEHLRRAFSEGYECEGLYQEERVRDEFPAGAWDSTHSAQWQKMDSPSKIYLDKADMIAAIRPRATVEVVWLTNPPGVDEDYRGWFDPHEAVMVSDPNIHGAIFYTA